jgi:hypothetical protein
MTIRFALAALPLSVAACAPRRLRRRRQPGRQPVARAMDAVPDICGSLDQGTVLYRAASYDFRRVPDANLSAHAGQRHAVRARPAQYSLSHLIILEQRRRELMLSGVAPTGIEGGFRESLREMSTRGLDVALAAPKQLARLRTGEEQPGAANPDHRDCPNPNLAVADGTLHAMRTAADSRAADLRVILILAAASSGADRGIPTTPPLKSHVP